MFLAGFPMPPQDHICHRLAIVKLDMHPDDPYLMDDVIAVAKLLLTGSAFQSTIPPITNALNLTRTIQLPITHSKDLLSQLSLSCLSIHLQLLKLRPTLLLPPPYYVTGVQTQVTLLVTARTPMNGSMPAGLSVELTADSTCQMGQIFPMHLEDDVL